MADASILWQPPAERIGRSRMYQFMQDQSRRHGFAPRWPDLHNWSVTRADDFWQAMFDLAEIAPARPAEAVRRGQGMLDTRWFPGMELNFAGHLLRHNDDHVAIEAEDERGRRRRLTYHELTQVVAACAAGLQAVGVGPGDRVAGFVPNIPEAVIAMLATASLGALWSSCSPDFGITGILDRFGQIKPKVLFAADGYQYNGRAIDCRQRIAGITERLEGIATVVVIGFLEDPPEIAGLPKAVRWNAFVGAGAAPVCTAVPFDHPLYIMYSSGTTGMPKCIVHGHGGTLLQQMKEHLLHGDLRRDDRIFYFTTCGWMMWNWLVSALGVGATVVLYEGSPAHPTLDHLWDLAERLGVTVFGTSPKFLATCQKRGHTPGTEHDLSELRSVLSTGAPLTVENFRWVYDAVKADVQLASISGGTDIISCFMLGNPLLPVRAGEIQSLGLGMDVRAFDDQGERVIGVKGELVCVSPFPSQPVGFWNDPDGAAYRSAYFEHYPGIWRHGDFVELTPTGGVIVYGRSDATLNPGGVRIGTAEIYRVVESIEEVADSLVVGREVGGDVEVCLFVVLRQGLTLDAALTTRIRSRIAEGATQRHVPKHIHQVSAVPYTISGKKVELAVSRIIHGRSVPNRDALANPEALDQFVNFRPAP